MFFFFLFGVCFRFPSEERDKRADNYFSWSFCSDCCFRLVGFPFPGRSKWPNWIVNPRKDRHGFNTFADASTLLKCLLKVQGKSAINRDLAVRHNVFMMARKKCHYSLKVKYCFCSVSALIAVNLICGQR